MRRTIFLVVLILIATCLVSRAASTRTYKLVQPWSKLTTLTDDQREKIYHIHRKSLADQKAIKEQEKKEILALLTDDQKLELVESDEKAAVQRKKEAAADRMPTTAAATQQADAEEQ